MKSPVALHLCLVTVMLISLVQMAKAETLTNEVGNKASYCAQVLKDKIPAIESMEQLAISRAKDSKHPLKKESLIQAERMNDLLMRTKSDLKRLQRYLILKLSHLDGEALLVAAATAIEDRKSFQICDDKCSMNPFENFEKYSACTTSCQFQLGNPNLRLQSCNNIDWLPF